jgi:hypothetical protein
MGNLEAWKPALLVSVQSAVHTSALGKHILTEVRDAGRREQGNHKQVPFGHLHFMNIQMSLLPLSARAVP